VAADNASSIRRAQSSDILMDSVSMNTHSAPKVRAMLFASQRDAAELSERR
jgi:hypothetical protein